MEGLGSALPKLSSHTLVYWFVVFCFCLSVLSRTWPFPIKRACCESTEKQDLFLGSSFVVFAVVAAIFHFSVVATVGVHFSCCVCGGGVFLFVVVFVVIIK